jgi:hypothetical protein
MTTTIEDWIALSPNLKKQCEKIRGDAISTRTWRNWERLSGAVYPQGKKVCSRKYTDEQTQLLLCLAWLRKHYPRLKVTYRSLRAFWQSNEYKIEEVFDECCNATNESETNSTVEVKSQPIQIALSQVKNCCDAILNHSLSRNAFASWKQYVGITKYERFVDEGKAALLVFMACWRHDNPTKSFPSVNRLLVMMQQHSRAYMSLETASSARMWLTWRIRGCIGKDLPKYLAACGYKVSTRTLYNWGNFQQRKHYSVVELAEWQRIAQEKRRYGT